MKVFQWLFTWHNQAWYNSYRRICGFHNVTVLRNNMPKLTDQQLAVVFADLWNRKNSLIGQSANDATDQLKDYGVSLIGSEYAELFAEIVLDRLLVFPLDQKHENERKDLLALFKKTAQNLVRTAKAKNGQVLFLLENWWREAGLVLADVCLAKSVFSC